MAQVTYVQSLAVTNTTTNATTTTVNKPTGTQDGDLLVAHFVYYGGITITTLSGWTLLDSSTGTGAVVAVYWKIAASEGSDYTWSHTSLGGSAPLALGVTAWRNTHATSPLAIYSITRGGTSTTTVSAAAITPTTTPNGLVLGLIGITDFATSFSTYAIDNNNPTWTEIYDQNATKSTGKVSAAAAYGGYDFITTTGTFAATIADTVNRPVTFFLFIKPAGFTFSVALTTASAIVTPAFSLVIAVTGLLSAATAFISPTITTGLSLWRNTAKNSVSTTNVTKHAASVSNTSKSSSSWTNTSKS